MFDIDLTKHLAELSKINFSDEELAEMTADMSDITQLMDKVSGFADDVEPYELESVDYNDLRADDGKDSEPNEKITKNAKNVKNNSFVVPKVV